MSWPKISAVSWRHSSTTPVCVTRPARLCPTLLSAQYANIDRWCHESSLVIALQWTRIRFIGGLALSTEPDRSTGLLKYLCHPGWMGPLCSVKLLHWMGYFNLRKSLNLLKLNPKILLPSVMQLGASAAPHTYIYICIYLYNVANQIHAYITWTVENYKLRFACQLTHPPFLLTHI